MRVLETEKWALVLLVSRQWEDRDKGDRRHIPVNVKKCPGVWGPQGPQKPLAEKTRNSCF